VLQESDPQLDPAVLAKAQYVEYRFPNVPGEPDRFTHTPDFDGRGNVWIMDRGGESLVEVDPVAGRITDHKGHGGGEFLALDRDGTIWYGGLSHFDPRKNVHDEYKFEWKQSFRSIPVSSMVLDSHGDLWLTLLTTGGLGKLDRKTNNIVWLGRAGRSRTALRNRPRSRRQRLVRGVSHERDRALRSENRIVPSLPPHHRRTDQHSTPGGRFEECGVVGDLG
jgi:streptogramin lyase